MPRWTQKVKHHVKRVLFTGADNHSDLDSDAANATDAHFSEILRSKQSHLSDPRVGALKNQELATETESIRTEDFESTFQQALPADSSLRSLPSRSFAEDSSVLTEDFEDRFKANLKVQQALASSKPPPVPRQALSQPRPHTSVTRNSPISRRSPAGTRQTPTRQSPAPNRQSPSPKRPSSRNSGLNKSSTALEQLAVDTLDELSDIEPEIIRMRTTSPHHATPLPPNNGHYEADSESEDGEFAQQIKEQSSRIQKEIELERRLKTRQAQRAASQQPQHHEFPASGFQGYNSLERQTNGQHADRQLMPRYRGSGSYSNLPSAQDLASLQCYSASTPDVSSLYAAQQASSLIKNQLEEDSNIMKRMNDDRMNLLQEISRLQDQLQRLEDEVSGSELQAKENRARAEESRSHLMVAEFKKEAVLKEISRLSSEVEQGKRIIEEAEMRQEQEDDILNKLGLTIQQIPAIVEDRDKLKTELELQEKANEKNKDVMSRQLQDTKTEASTMQQAMQEKIDTLSNNVQQLSAQLERVSSEKDEFKKERDAALSKCDSLQRDMAAGDQAKSQALEQTIKGYDDMRRRVEKEAAEARAQLTNELNGQKKLLEIEEHKGIKLREEIILRDELNNSLREQLHSVREKATEEEESHDHLLRELKQQLRDAETEKLAAWDACKQQFEVEKEKLLEMTRDDLERQHEDTLAAVRGEYNKHITQLQHSVKTKDSEAHLLRDRLSELEQEGRRTVDRLKADVRLQVEQAVENEKKIWIKEQKYTENEQLKQYREKEGNEIEQLRLQVESETRKRHQLEETLASTKDDLEQLKTNYNKLNQEKQAVQHKLKQADSNQTSEVDKIKHELKQHYEKIMAALRDDLDEKDQELERVRMENSTLVQSEAESSLALEKFEKMMIHEINEECRRTADHLGVQARKAQAVSFSSRSGSPGKSHIRKRTASRSLTASAVANLRACNEELRNSISELKSEVSELSATIEKSEKAKEQELDNLRSRLTNEKKQEMEEMRMSLAKMPVCRRSLVDPRDPYQVKAERKASEKALRKSISGSYSQLNGANLDYTSTGLDEPLETSATNCMQSVQDRMKHIRAGSPFRYRSNPLANSTPDISRLSSSSQPLSSAGMDSLEQKVRLAELKARLADERASRNHALLSQKMHEVNELQQTLNNQTKNLMGLERSYDDFRSSQYSPPRYSMNSTFPR